MNGHDGEWRWERGNSSVEVRTKGDLPDGRPALDEVVANGASVHLEQMSHDQWWMGLESGGKHFHLWFVLREGRLQVQVSDQDDEDAVWEGDSREPSSSLGHP
jgi:hypothetical protein